MHITGDMFDCGGNGVPGCEWEVHDNVKAFNLEISLVQSFEGASIVKVVVKWYSKVGVHDDSDKGRVFSRRRE